MRQIHFIFTLSLPKLLNSEQTYVRPEVGEREKKLVEKFLTFLGEGDREREYTPVRRPTEREVVGEGSRRERERERTYEMI